MYGQPPSGTTAYLDQSQIAAATAAGRIVKLNTYHSPDGCIAGIKPVYAGTLGISQLIGVQQGMRERSLVLEDDEFVNRVDIRYDRR